jgi:hypothetical protein
MLKNTGFRIFLQLQARLILSVFHWPVKRKRGKKGLQPSEVKDQDERLSGALDFIHLLGTE